MIEGYPRDIRWWRRHPVYPLECPLGYRVISGPRRCPADQYLVVSGHAISKLAAEIEELIVIWRLLVERAHKKYLEHTPPKALRALALLPIDQGSRFHGNDTHVRELSIAIS